MYIKDDALRILAVLYNHKIKGIDEIRSDNSEIIKLGLSEIKFKNALEFLKEKKLSKVYNKSPVLKTKLVDIFDEPKEKTKEELEEEVKYEYEK